MRLINTKSLRLEEFFNRPVPVYAILSHTWGEHEVIYEDYYHRKLAALEDDAGLEKIKRCCSRAAADHHQYVWVDSCCIDKRSSAELAEAINSMYNWYAGAVVCYVILSDVVSTTDWEQATDSLRKSRWFTRGWTLQELLAPSHLIFLNQEWKMMFEYHRKRNEVPSVELSVETGGLFDQSVADVPLHARMVTMNWRKHELPNILSNITGIEVGFIFGSRDPVGAIISEKMSWAAKRHTTRQEDEAYCLLGLFDISIPLLYGEGTKALRRLQAAIAAESDDHTLFAWGFGSEIVQPEHEEILKAESIFASTTRAFTNGSLLERLSAEEVPWYPDVHYSITNKGVNMTLPYLDPPGLKGISSLVAFKCTNRISEHWKRSHNVVVMMLYHSHTDSAQMFRLASRGVPILVPTHLFENAKVRVSYLQLTVSSPPDPLPIDQVGGLLLVLERLQESIRTAEEQEDGPITLRRYSDDPSSWGGGAGSGEAIRHLVDDEGDANQRDSDFLGAKDLHEGSSVENAHDHGDTAKNATETLALVVVEAYPPHLMVDMTEDTITIALSKDIAMIPVTPQGLSYFGLRLSHGIPDPAGAGTILILIQYQPAIPRAPQLQHQVRNVRLISGNGYPSLMSYILQLPPDGFSTDTQDTVDLGGSGPDLYGHLRCTSSFDNSGHCVLSFKWLHIILNVKERQPLEQLNLWFPSYGSGSMYPTDSMSVASVDSIPELKINTGVSWSAEDSADPLRSA